MKKSGGGRGPISTRQLDRWRRSAEFRAIAAQAIRAWNERRKEIPKCGAKRRNDGQPCQQLPLENGRCRFHGGRTPKGRDWHKIAMPKRGEPDGRFERRLAEAAKRKKRRKAINAAATPEQLAAYEAWQRSHKPGSATDRARGRRQRETAAWLATLDIQSREVSPPAPAIDITTFREGLFA